VYIFDEWRDKHGIDCLEAADYDKYEADDCDEDDDDGIEEDEE